MFVPDFVVSGLHGVLQSLWTHFLETSVRWRAWPISSPNSVADGIAYTPKIPCSCGVVMRSSRQAPQPWWKGESWVVGRNSPVCWEKRRTLLQTVLETLRLRTGLSGSPLAQSSLVINIEGLIWQTSAWPTRNKLQPAGKCCNYICGAILEIRLVVVFHR